jgi:hypothetical protein
MTALRAALAASAPAVGVAGAACSAAGDASNGRRVATRGGRL